MTEQMISQLEAMQKMATDTEGVEVEKSSLEFDEAKIREDFKKYEEMGITLKKVSSETRDGWRYVHVDIDFKDVSRLKETKVFSDTDFSISRNEAGDYVVTFSPGGDQDMMDAEPEMMAMMMPMLKGMRVATKINTPTDIVSTTAPVKSARSASWVIDVDQDPESFKQLKGMTMQVVFSGKGVNIPEFK